MTDIEKAELLLQNGNWEAYFHRMTELGHEGNVEALYKLGMECKGRPNFLKNGDLPGNFVWFYIAALQGHAGAQAEMVAIAGQLDETDIKKAAIIAKAFCT